MGLFRGKKDSSDDEVAAAERRFFDENFREELRNHGRWYFEKVINENGTLFKEDLDATVTHLNEELKTHATAQLDTALTQLDTELKAHVTQQIDEKFAQHSKTMEDAQNVALQAMATSAQTLQEQYQQLSTTLQQNVTEQQAMLTKVFEENKAQVTQMKDSQATALQWLAASVQTMQEQHQQLTAQLQQSVAQQQAMMVGVFEQNMARIIEHYLLSTLGDQYDLKAQLPSIIKEMEANKQAITDDMKL
jgi:hypothetical protein